MSVSVFLNNLIIPLEEIFVKENWPNFNLMNLYESNEFIESYTSRKSSFYASLY